MPIFNHTCKKCGKIFYSRIEKNPYCSPKCAYDDRIGKPRHPNSGKKKTKKMTSFICKNCGKQFERFVYPSSKDKIKFEFCSPTCRNKARIYNGPVRHKSDDWKTCPICGHQSWRKNELCRKHRHQNSPLKKKVKSKLVKNRQKIWDKEKTDFLIENYSSLGGAEIAKILGLTPNQVIGKANNIHLKLSKEASHRIIHDKAKEYMTNHNPMKNDVSKNKVKECWKNEEWKNKALERLAIGHQKIRKDKPTKLEAKVIEYLIEFEIDFEPQFLVKPNFIVDIKIGDLIIQADGDYWHGHPRFEPLTDRQKAQQKRDKAQDKYLTTCGYFVERIWEHDLTKELVYNILLKHNLIR